MKLINRKTRKAIDKSVRKAVKKHGRALMAGLASGVASSLATLAKTEAPGKRGQSNLGQIVERVQEALTDSGDKRKHRHDKKKHSQREAAAQPPRAAVN